jgi:hypothetical protein
MPASVTGSPGERKGRTAVTVPKSRFASQTLRAAPPQRSLQLYQSIFCIFKVRWVFFGFYVHADVTEPTDLRPPFIQQAPQHLHNPKVLNRHYYQGLTFFPGNASSLPPRLPFLSPVLRSLRDEKTTGGARYVMVCLSYRAYWTSRGRASEPGIAKDAAAALKWVSDQEARAGGDRVPVIIWGQSIGAGVATTCAAKPENFAENLDLRMLILETPFLSIREMLVTLYPQKWLPYRYLWPFLRNHLDSWKALEQIAMRRPAPSVVILAAGRDELVPKLHGDALEQRCQQLGIQVDKHQISGAYHTEVMIRPEGPPAVLKAIRAVRSSLAIR